VLFLVTLYIVTNRSYYVILQMSAPSYPLVYRVKLGSLSDPPTLASSAIRTYVDALEKSGVCV
jgi:hypothetical protein